MFSIHHTDSVSNDSTVVIGLDIGTYVQYSVTLFVLSLLTAIILVTWAGYILYQGYGYDLLDAAHCYCREDHMG